MGRIIHGNQNFGYAPIVSTGEGTYAFGSPVMLKGMVSSTIEVEQSTTNIPADNITFCMVKGAKVRTAEVGLRYIDKEYAQFLGYKLNNNGMLTDTGKFPNHCIFFETLEEDCETGISTRTLHYLYNVQASTPSVETNTDEEEVEAVELTVNYSSNDSAFVTDDDNAYVQYGYITRTDDNAVLYDTFVNQVIPPNMAVTPPTPPTPTYEYVEVTPVGTENPSEEGWYELVDGEYVLTTDTEVNTEKTYYERVEQ